MSNDEHAIVIGGSISGMISAQILSKYFKKVTIIEKDDNLDSQTLRKSVPHAIHPHILLAKGIDILSSIFPDFIHDIAISGAVRADISKDSEHFVGHDWQPRFKSSLVCYFCSRRLLESIIKKQISKNDKINFICGIIVMGLVSKNEKITGVKIKKSDQSYENGILHGDLIIDASGKNSKTIEWLSSLGYEKPEEIHVDSMIGYASRYYKIPQLADRETKLTIIFNKPPHFPKMGGIISIEDDKWLVGLYSIGKDLPSTNEMDFLEFSKNLAHSKVYDMIKNAEPLSQIYGYRMKGGRRIMYENLSSWPTNFLVIGDAVCTFNPFYGQGMTVAALGGLVLDNCLKKYLSKTNFGNTFQKKLSKINSRPWLLATGEDFRWPTTIGDRPNILVKLIQRYADKVLEITPHSKRATKSFQSMMHMRQTPLSLFHPTILSCVLWNILFSNLRLSKHH
ncbi:MAG TPA: 2-polyprenyl-6-methoxyphenol hydroxylase-like oxidoreductase [Candidatus Nitrosotalea sp.]|nr:2-polyprenyl-6-methoxyphenol hydroxylase-like oxidoreductase [Candidatus Nitrosotalea sp.]